LLFAVATIGSITSCVYFNTYYNAEKYFRQAEKARAEAEAQGAGARDARSRSQYVILYDKAVRKASIVLEKYPDSDLIDDAMFIAGRALYWQRDYQYAMRSFRDLELNFPESEYSDRARLWRGRTLVALGLAADARALFSDLMREGSHVGDRAGMRQGELAAGEGDRRAAIL
jgi:TolA-binding protein